MGSCCGKTRQTNRSPVRGAKRGDGGDDDVDAEEPTATTAASTHKPSTKTTQTQSTSKPSDGGGAGRYANASALKRHVAEEKAYDTLEQSFFKNCTFGTDETFNLPTKSRSKSKSKASKASKAYKTSKKAESPRSPD